ncbi:MAG: peptidylprolyl isomerase [Deltaproteobacteria bacterium]|nr:peptidylprolyl isomerase [Deltaproteobacteria bacterium]
MIRRHKITYLFFVITFWAILSNIGLAEVLDRIVAIVNDDVITYSELSDKLMPVLQRMQLDPRLSENQEKVFTITQSALELMINQKLAEKEIERLKVKVSEQEVAAALAKAKQDNFMTENDLERMLKAKGMTIKDYQQEIREEILKAKLLNSEIKAKIVIPEEKIKDYFQKNKDQFEGQNQVGVKHIFIGIPENATATVKHEARKKAEMVLEKLRAGADFAKVAAEYSEAPTAREGGDLGLVREEDMSAEMKNAISKLKKGEPSDILETATGLQILMVTKRSDAQQKSLEDVRDTIHEKLYREELKQRYDIWLKGLKDKSYIKIML